MIWLLLLATFTCTTHGKEPKILVDTEYTSGFPEYFQRLKVKTNSGDGFKYRWEHNGNRIDSTYRSILNFGGETTTWLTPDRKNPSDDRANLAYQGIYQFFMETPTGTISGHKLKVEFTYVGEFSNKLPSDIRNVVVGQAAFIKCPQHTPGNNFIYKWGKTSGGSGTKFINAGSNYIVLENGSLFFSHLKEKDVGYINDFDITCGMEANVGKDNRFTWSHVVKLNNSSQNWTKFGPEIVTKLPVKVFTVGETIFMKCAATGNPVPKYTWKMRNSEGNEKAIVDGQDDIVFVDGDPRILEIRKTKKSHAGKYTCTATIGQKSDSVEGKLTYQEKPSWTSEEIKSVKPSIYSSHSWQCVATGSPMPYYEWYKNGKNITNSSHFLIDEGKITFPKLEKEDSGMYECVATNDFGNIYRTAHLDVQAEKPTFAVNRGMTTLFLNDPGTINCSAKAAPVAKNTWTKNGIVIDTNLPLYELVNNQHLIIKKVSKSDIGNYTCVAKNLYGEDSKEIQVAVVGEIKFIQAPVDLNITRTETIQLSCEAKGEKNIVVRYKWRFDDKELKTGVDGVVWSLDSHVLLILNAEVKRTGVYECIAFIDKPSYAEKKRSATVTVRGPPEEINTLKVEGGCGNLEAKLTWSVVYRGPITHFIIEWRTSYGTAKWHNDTSKVPADRREYVVKDLSPYVQYSFRVLAVNAIGTSGKKHNTDFKDCKTPARAPTKCPKPTGYPGKKDKLTIEWKKMELFDYNGPKFNYRLGYKKRGGSTWQNKTLGAMTEKFDIPNAGYYELWDFRIQGVNEAGNGSVCSGFANSGQDAPNKMPLKFRQVLTGADYVDLEWEPIVPDRGSVDGYKIKYFQKPDLGTTRRRRRSDDPYSCDNNVCIKDIPGPLKSSTRVHRLAPVKTYEMSIWGYNSGGAGPSNALVVVTKEGVPGVPEAVVAVPYAKFVVLTWKEPKIPNGVIKAYKVGISNSPEKKVDGMEKKRYVFRGLKPDQEYEVFVAAETESGEGTRETRKVRTLIKLAVPGQPRPPLVEGTGKDGVNVTYLGGEKAGFPETFSVAYRVKSRGENGVINQTAPQPLDGEERQVIVIYGLDTAVEYEFATFARNYHGDSKWSDYNSTFPGAEVITPIARKSPIYKRSWFVAVVVVVCVLLLVLIIALLITRKRGERYPVGKREKKRAGILDNIEEDEANTCPMKPPRKNGHGMNRNGSRSSLPNRDPDRDSLDEYGEDKFGEDAGSLIGEYNDDKKLSTVAGPEFV